MVDFAIAIDGPAGSGKSTIAKCIAKRLHIKYIDTGAMYRAVGLYCTQNGINTENEEAVAAVLPQIDLKFKLTEDGQEIYLNHVNVTKEVRTQAAGKGASDVAKYLPVREKLVEIQRLLAFQDKVVMDGRDIGTNVLPHAEIKIFLTASVEERTRRRLHELEENGAPGDFAVIQKQIEERDYNDSHREHNPLKKAPDAEVLDVTEMSVEEAVQAVMEIIQLKIG